MSEQNTTDNPAMLEAIQRALDISIARQEDGGSAVDARIESLKHAYSEGVKAGEAKGGYRAGFEAGLAAADKTIKELQATVAACRAANLIDENNNVRRVLGKLPVTADGYLAGSDAELWWVDNSKYVQRVCVLPTDVSDCFSTREAAEAAKDKP